MNILTKLRRLERDVTVAKASLGVFVKDTWPPGTEIEWERSGNIQSGEVVLVGSDRIKVRNVATDKTYWITLYDVSLALESRRQQSLQRATSMRDIKANWVDQ